MTERAAQYSRQQSDPVQNQPPLKNKSKLGAKTNPVKSSVTPKPAKMQSKTNGREFPLRIQVIQQKGVRWWRTNRADWIQVNIRYVTLFKDSETYGESGLCEIILNI